MSDIVQRNHRYYVVAYDGHDPITGRERRRWHPAGATKPMPMPCGDESKGNGRRQHVT